MLRIKNIAELKAALASRADLSGAYLGGANLSVANLSGADLSGANLSVANLSVAYLGGTNLSGADLSGANLSGAYLRGAYLRGADLRGADLRGANLRGANLNGADLGGANLPAFQIPQDGSLTVWKKVIGGLVKLEIPPSARRTATPVGRKCRAEFALVLEAPEGAVDTYTGRTSYIVGQIVRPDKYDGDIRLECTNGIHFFLTREEAEAY